MSVYPAFDSYRTGCTAQRHLENPGFSGIKVGSTLEFLLKPSIILKLGK